MKEKGEKPKRRKLPILDPDHFDDCGEDLGELTKLADSSEELCWWETPDNLVLNDFLTTSEFRVIGEPHWLNDDTHRPDAWHFLGFKACDQYFESSTGLILDPFTWMSWRSWEEKDEQQR